MAVRSSSLFIYYLSREGQTLGCGRFQPLHSLPCTHVRSGGETSVLGHEGELGLPEDLSGAGFISVSVYTGPGSAFPCYDLVCLCDACTNNVVSLCCRCE